MPVQQISYLNRFLDPVTEMLPRDVLERIVNFRFDDVTRARAAELAEKANEGQLTDDERAEYSEYVETLDLIGIMQATARQILAKQAS
jgi:hypothetical protein